jgi:hypothetical protein
MSLRWRRCRAPSRSSSEFGPKTGSNSSGRAAPARSASRSPVAIALIAAGFDTKTYGIPPDSPRTV